MRECSATVSKDAPRTLSAHILVYMFIWKHFYILLYTRCRVYYLQGRGDYRLVELVSRLENLISSCKIGELLKNLQTRLSRGRRSRNKVSVGEPAEGSIRCSFFFNLCILYIALTFYLCIHISIENSK